LILLLVATHSSDAQTVEAGPVTVTAEPIATPTPHDNWREMRQHIMPEVSGTQITVTEKATVIKLEQQPPIQNNDLQEEFIKTPRFARDGAAHAGSIQLQLSRTRDPQESEFVTVLMAFPETRRAVGTARR
jgi:hypothetical protein